MFGKLCVVVLMSVTMLSQMLRADDGEFSRRLSKVNQSRADLTQKEIEQASRHNTERTAALTKNQQDWDKMRTEQDQVRVRHNELLQKQQVQISALQRQHEESLREIERERAQVLREHSDKIDKLDQQLSVLQMEAKRAYTDSVKEKFQEQDKSRTLLEAEKVEKLSGNDKRRYEAFETYLKAFSQLQAQHVEEQKTFDEEMISLLEELEKRQAMLRATLAKGLEGIRAQRASDSSDIGAKLATALNVSLNAKEFPIVEEGFLIAQAPLSFQALSGRRNIRIKLRENGDTVTEGDFFDRLSLAVERVLDGKRVPGFSLDDAGSILFEEKLVQVEFYYLADDYLLPFESDVQSNLQQRFLFEIVRGILRAPVFELTTSTGHTVNARVVYVSGLAAEPKAASARAAQIIGKIVAGERVGISEARARENGHIEIGGVAYQLEWFYVGDKDKQLHPWRNYDKAEAERLDVRWKSHLEGMFTFPKIPDLVKSKLSKGYLPIVPGAEGHEVYQSPEVVALKAPVWCPGVLIVQRGSTDYLLYRVTGRGDVTSLGRVIAEAGLRGLACTPNSFAILAEAYLSEDPNAGVSDGASLGEVPLVVPATERIGGRLVRKGDQKGPMLLLFIDKTLAKVIAPKDAQFSQIASFVADDQNRGYHAWLAEEKEGKAAAFEEYTVSLSSDGNSIEAAQFSEAPNKTEFQKPE